MLNWLKKDIKLKTLGQVGEEFAQAEYRKRGYEIVAANFFNKKGLRKGEVDFIAKNKTEIIFVEVKSRTDGSKKFGQGGEAVNIFKQIKLLKAVKIYLLQNPKYLNLRPQIDVCVVKCNIIDKKPYSAIIIPNAVEDWG